MVKSLLTRSCFCGKFIVLFRNHCRVVAYNFGIALGELPLVVMRGLFVDVDDGKELLDLIVLVTEL